MAITDATYTFRITYNANGGTGAPATDTISLTTPIASPTLSLAISGTRPTRTGYTFANWWYGGTRFTPNQYVSHTFTKNGYNQIYTLNLTAAWTENASTWGTTPSSVQLDGTTAYTFNISKASTADHHTVKFTLGSESLTYTNVGTSQSVTFPTSWQTQIPNSASGSITATLTSYNSSGSQIGSAVTKSITANVPSSVVPTLSITHTTVNSNTTVAGWGILLQGYSAISFSATAAGAGGSTISSIKFSGAGLNQSGSGTTATSSILFATGSQTWTVTATDSRGRTATQTYTETVFEYTPPSISNANANRCRQNGTIDEATGTYALFNATYSYSSADSHNALTEVIESKLQSGSTWTTLTNSYTSGTDVVVGGGLDVDKTYDLRLTITDSLGNSATYSLFIASVVGFAYGLKNDRARFGGVPTRAGLQIDWDIFLGDRQIMKSLWTGSWSTGDITVDGISNYTLYLVRMSGHGTLMYVSRYDDGVDVHFRGMNGFALSASSEQTFYIWAKMSGDTLTMQYCHSLSGSTRTAMTVAEIIGII